MLPKKVLAQSPSQVVGSSFPGGACPTYSSGTLLPQGFNLLGPQLLKWEAICWMQKCWMGETIKHSEGVGEPLVVKNGNQAHGKSIVEPWYDVESWMFGMEWRLQPK